MTNRPHVKYFLKTSLVFGLSIALTACGGSKNSSSTSSDPEPAGPATTYVNVSGIAIAEIPLANVQIKANCKDNTGFKDKVVTKNDGTWEAQVESNKLPCNLEVKTGIAAYHSYIDAAGSVNINPLTDLVVALATNQLPGDWYTSGKAITADKLNAANISITQELSKKKYVLPANVDLFKTLVVKNEAYRQLLLDFLSALGANRATIADYSALLTLVKDGNIRHLPAKTATSPTSTLLSVDRNVCQRSDILPNRYEHCLATVIPDFSDASLLSFLNVNSCLVQKDQGKLTVTQGDKTIVAILDGEQDDMLASNNSADILFAKTAKSNVALTITAKGKLVTVLAGSTDASGKEISIVCAGPK